MNTLNTMLIESCINGHLYSVKELIKEGADINYNDNQPFFEASNNSHIDIMEYLLDNGVDMDTTNDDEFSIDKYKVNIFDNLCKKGNLEAIEFLDRKVDLYEFKCSSHAFTDAIESNNINLVKYMCINDFMITTPCNDKINEEIFEYIYEYTLYNNSLDLHLIKQSITRDNKEKWLNKLNELIDNDLFKVIYNYNGGYRENLNSSCYDILIILINNNDDELFIKLYNYIKNIIKKEINFSNSDIITLMYSYLGIGMFKNFPNKKIDLNIYEKYFDIIVNKDNIYDFILTLFREKYYDDLVKFNNKYNRFITDKIKNNLFVEFVRYYKFKEIDYDKLEYISNNLDMYENFLTMKKIIL